MSNKNNRFNKRATFLGPVNADSMIVDEYKEENFPATEKSSQVEKFVSVKIKKLNLRASASKDGSILRELTQGTKLLIIDHIREWTKVQYKDTDKNLIGYVMSEFVEEV